MIKKLAWIAAAGFSVGFASMVAAYAAGGDALFTAENLRKLKIHLDDNDKCGGDATAIDTTQTERHLVWTGQDKVRISLSGTVHYRGGEGDDVIVRGAPNVIANVRVRGNRIELDCGGFGNNGSVDVTLPGRIFREISLAGSGEVVMENVNQSSLELSLAGSGTLQAEGTVTRLDVRIAGSGNAKLADLKVNALEISVAGSGNAEVAPIDSADIKVAGSGNIKLLTRPKTLETKVMGSGRIIQAGDST